MTTLVLCPDATSLAAVGADARLVRLLTENDARKDALLVELRLDRMPDASPALLRTVLERLGAHNTIVTCRAHFAGGGLPNIAEHLAHVRRALLREACHRGARYIDIERETLLADESFGELHADSPTKLIVSDHAWSETPALATLRSWRRQSEQLGADHVKQAVMATCADALLDGMALMQEPSPWLKPLTFVGMGEAGLFTRLLAGRSPFAPSLCYVALGNVVAPGQPPLTDAQQLYDVAAVTPETPVYAVLGNPVAHSRSPLLHNHTLRRAGRRGIYVALRCRTEVAPFIERAYSVLNLQGLSVTLPHKRNVLAVCDRHSPLVAQAQAANTLFAPQQRDAHSPMRWQADNTDGPAALFLLAQALGITTATAWRDKRVLVLGAGGAARTLGAALGASGAKLTFAARRSEAAASLATALGAHGIALVDQAAMHKALASCDIVVHCTPVGMVPLNHQSLLDEAQLRLLPAHALVFDTVYAPITTELLRCAHARGLRTVDGLALLKAQGDLQAGHFYNLQALTEPPPSQTDSPAGAPA